MNSNCLDRLDRLIVVSVIWSLAVIHDCLDYLDRTADNSRNRESLDRPRMFRPDRLRKFGVIEIIWAIVWEPGLTGHYTCVSLSPSFLWQVKWTSFSFFSLLLTQTSIKTLRKHYGIVNGGVIHKIEFLSKQRKWISFSPKSNSSSYCIQHRSEYFRSLWTTSGPRTAKSARWVWYPFSVRIFSRAFEAFWRSKNIH